MAKGKSAGGNTKEKLAQIYIDMVADDGPADVRVLDIVRKAGVNKNSFYYHFSSKYSVAYWIFRTDIASMIEEVFDCSSHVFPAQDSVAVEKDLFPELPYYVRLLTGARMFDQGAFLKQMVLALRKRQKFYRAMFKDQEPDNLKLYIQNLYYPAFLQDIEFIADGRYIPAQTRGFLARGSLALFVGMLENLVCSKELPDEVLDDAENPFWNILPESIEGAIRNHPVTATSFSLTLV